MTAKPHYILSLATTCLVASCAAPQLPDYCATTPNAAGCEEPTAAERLTGAVFDVASKPVSIVVDTVAGPALEEAEDIANRIHEVRKSRGRRSDARALCLAAPQTYAAACAIAFPDFHPHATTGAQPAAAAVRQQSRFARDEVQPEEPKELRAADVLDVEEPLGARVRADRRGGHRLLEERDLVAHAERLVDAMRRVAETRADQDALAEPTEEHGRGQPGAGAVTPARGRTPPDQANPKPREGRCEPPSGADAGAGGADEPALNWWRLKSSLRAYEGLSLEPYRDGGGTWHICNGHTFQVTQEECDALLELDMREGAQIAATTVGTDTWATLGPVRREALAHLGFATSFPTFTNLIAAVRRGDWHAAGDEVLDSEWARTVGETRANDVADQLRTGVAEPPT